jgi:4-hydroxybenzoate polyprenyltransferase
MTIERLSAVDARRDSFLLFPALVALLRPRQWTKNAVVFAALVFDLKLFDIADFLRVLGATLCFCLASSTVYIVNDIRDAESDRQHPRKRRRPIAAGTVSNRTAWWLAIGLLAVAMPFAFALRVEFGFVVVAYLALMTAYTLYVKHLVILDVFAISAGFVLRAAGGAVVIDVPISPWLYVCTVLLSLFLAFGKRRNELLLLDASAAAHRRNLEEYSPQLLDQFILITAAATVMSYSLYTFVAANVPGDHSMMLTIPFVLYAIFRYLFLVYRRDEGGSPEYMLLGDLPLLGCIALWGIAAVIILYAS